MNKFKIRILKNFDLNSLKFYATGILKVDTKLWRNVLTISIPLSRYILINYISTTEEALEVFKETIFKFETSKLLKSI